MALLGLSFLLASAWAAGRILLPDNPSWFPSERFCLRVGVGFAFLINALVALAWMGALYPASILLLLTLPIALIAMVRLSFQNSVRAALLPRSSRPHPDRLAAHLSLGTVAILAALDFLEALHIDLCPDRYHVVFARCFLNTHRMEFLPGSIISCYPKAIEMLFTVGLLFEPESGSSVIHCSFLPLAAMALYAAFRRTWGVAGGSLAALWLVGQTLLHKYGTMGFVDLGAAFFAAVALIPLLRWMDRPRLLEALLAGLLCGMSVSCKVTSGLLVVLPAAVGMGLVACSQPLRGWKRAWGGVLLFGAAALLVYSPWMIRNTLHSGSPFAPVLAQVFPLDPEFDLALKRFQNTHPMHVDRFLDNPWWSIRHYQDQIAFDGSSAALILPVTLLGLAALALLQRSRQALFLLVSAGLTFFLYALVSPDRSSRFSLPLMPVFCAAAAMVCMPVVSRLRPPLRMAFFVLFALGNLTVVLLGVTAYRGVTVHQPFFTRAAREAFLHQVDPVYPRTLEVNEILNGEDYITFHRAGLRWRFLETPLSPLSYWGYDLALYLWEEAKVTDPLDPEGGFHSLLLARGVTHILAASRDLVISTRDLEIVREWPDAVLYRVRRELRGESRTLD